MTDPQQSAIFPRVKLGVSSCLLGQEVRFDGGHKRDKFVVGTLSKFVDYMPVCPEVAIGMGIPRRPIRLVGDSEQPKTVGTDDPTLNDPVLRENFVTRIFVYHNWQRLTEEPITSRGLIAFHSDHK